MILSRGENPESSAQGWISVVRLMAGFRLACAAGSRPFLGSAQLPVPIAACDLTTAGLQRPDILGLCSCFELRCLEHVIRVNHVLLRSALVERRVAFRSLVQRNHRRIHDFRDR